MSVQLQLRRDTLANIASAQGAAGELFVSTDTHEAFIQDGSTPGGWRASGVRGVFGSILQPAILESPGAGGETITTDGTAFTSAVQLPAGYKYILGVGWLINSAITGCTTMEVGLTGSPAAFATGITGLGAGYTSIYQPSSPLRYDSSPISLLLTSTAGGNFTGGAIRLIVHYLMLSPPTS